LHYPYSCYSCGPEAHHGKGKIVGITTNGSIIGRDLCTGKYMVDTDGKTDIDWFNSIHQCKGAESDELEESKKRTKMSMIRTGLAITTFGIVLFNLWTNKKQEKDISDIMDLV